MRACNSACLAGLAIRRQPSSESPQGAVRESRTRGSAVSWCVQTLEGAVALAEKLRVAISHARCSVSNGDGLIEIEVTASLGVAAFRGDEKAFFNDADRALQIAGLRRGGRHGD